MLLGIMLALTSSSSPVEPVTYAEIRMIRRHLTTSMKHVPGRDLAKPATIDSEPLRQSRRKE